MALPTVLLKAKNVVKKGAAAYNAGKQAKNLKDGEASVLPIFAKYKALIISGIAVIIIPVMILLLITVYPFIVAQSAFASGLGGSGGSGGGGTSASGIVNCAREQLGKSYVWGATGPDHFDCSGLVYYCYQQTYSLTIGRTTSVQITDSHFTTVSSVNDLRAGGIILCTNSKVHHVGVYSGEQTVIHAPQTGDVVKEVPVERFCSGEKLTYRNFNGS